jgi:hypothetical protein
MNKDHDTWMVERACGLKKGEDSLNFSDLDFD